MSNQKKNIFNRWSLIPPPRTARAVYRTFLDFSRLEAAGGIVLIITAVVALVWANSPFSESYFDLWHTTFSIGFGGDALVHDLHWWINEALMVIFFFVVGLEIKREVLVGELSSLRQAALPVAAAIGGMVVPAGIYLFFNAGQPGQNGWGVPMATDIAFALGVMALLGSRVPIGLKVFLTALAIVDDIGAVLVIALFYTGDIRQVYLFAAGGIVAMLMIANLFGVRRLLVYTLLGIALWLAFLASGVHATLAGVIGALTIPVRKKIDEESFLRNADQHLKHFAKAGEDDSRLLNSEQQEALHELEVSVEAVMTPLQRLEHLLHGWVIFLIVPLFALANAGVQLDRSALQFLTNPITLGVVFGLLLGKQIGIFLASWLVAITGLARLPRGVDWPQIYATGWLAGIGFTMSLFISELAFVEDEFKEASKVGILIASFVAGIAGYLLLRWATRKKPVGGVMVYETEDLEEEEKPEKAGLPQP